MEKPIDKLKEAMDSEDSEGFDEWYESLKHEKEEDINTSKKKNEKLMNSLLFGE